MVCYFKRRMLWIANNTLSAIWKCSEVITFQRIRGYCKSYGSNYYGWCWMQLQRNATKSSVSCIITTVREEMKKKLQSDFASQEQNMCFLLNAQNTPYNENNGTCRMKLTYDNSLQIRPIYLFICSLIYFFLVRCSLSISIWTNGRLKAKQQQKNSLNFKYFESIERTEIWRTK